MKAKLKKYSPLGLLALAIVAGVVAVSTHAPAKKDVEAFEVGYDAGFDVIGYFACNRYRDIKINFALAREGDTFSVFYYAAEDGAIIAKGKPTDFTYLTRSSVIKNPRITPLQYKWNGDTRSIVLDRTNGKVTVSSPGHKANLPGCKGDDCLALEPFSDEYQCKYGKVGEVNFWNNAYLDYVAAWEEKAVKF